MHTSLNILPAVERVLTADGAGYVKSGTFKYTLNDAGKPVIYPNQDHRTFTELLQ